MANVKKFGSVNNSVYGKMEEALDQEVPEEENGNAFENRSLDSNKGRRKKNSEEIYSRMNMAFYEDTYNFVKTMAIVRGQTVTDFVNEMIRDEMKKYKDVYEQVKKFQNMF